jgi:peptide-methionine (S)-S-oxide reductase
LHPEWAIAKKVNCQLRINSMASRSLGSMVLVCLLGTLVVEGRAQDSGTPPAATPDSSTSDGLSKASPPVTTDSPGDKSAATSPQPKPKLKSELAAFGAGCFWHVEDVFERLDGVKSAVSGYAGGNVPYPSYEMVHEGTTGHAETVVVEYDPNVISYEQLLKVFWSSHDPTSLNRQGPDVGPQYRSVIFYYNEEQRRAALASYRDLTRARVYRSRIVTDLVPMRAFFQAEDYHQDYYGGKPRATTRRRKTTPSKAKKTQAKVSKPSAAATESPRDQAETAPSPQPRT